MHRSGLLALTAFLTLSACSDSDAPATDSKAEKPVSPVVELPPESELKPQTVSHGITEFVFRCSDGEEFTVSYGDQLAIVLLEDQTHQLRQQSAATGRRYSDEALELHIKGSDVLLLSGDNSRDCVMVEQHEQRLPGPDLTPTQADQ